MHHGLNIITSVHLTESEPVASTFIDKFFLWIERLCNEAEIYYYWKRVTTTSRQVPSKKAVVIGDTIYIHPVMLARLKVYLKEFKPT